MSSFNVSEKHQILDNKSPYWYYNIRGTVSSPMKKYIRICGWILVIYTTNIVYLILLTYT